MGAAAKTGHLQAIVKQRARALRAEELRYREALSTLANELYRNERGKATAIGELGATTGVIGPLLEVGEDDRWLFAKAKKGKAKTIAAVETLISPWVADVYEQ